jgi:hypothetical protein
MARIRHQHAVAAGKAEIGGQRRALVAALFLDDLDQQHLTALDDVLDLVAAAQRHALGAQFVGFLGLGRDRPDGGDRDAGGRHVRHRRFRARRRRRYPHRRASKAFSTWPSSIVATSSFRTCRFRWHLPSRSPSSRYRLRGPAIVGIIAVVVAVFVFIAVFGSAQRGFLLGVGGFFGQQRLAVFLGDLVVIGMDFAECEEPVPVAAEIDESRLKRGFYPWLPWRDRYCP